MWQNFPGCALILVLWHYLQIQISQSNKSKLFDTIGRNVSRIKFSQSQSNPQYIIGENSIHVRTSGFVVFFVLIANIYNFFDSTVTAVYASNPQYEKITKLTADAKFGELQCSSLVP